MGEVTRVLLVEDLSSDAELVEREARRVLPESRFLRVEARDEFVTALVSFNPDIILSDYRLPQFDGMSALKLAQAHAPDTPFIVVTGSMNEDTAVECMKAGAWDYVIKEHLKRLGAAILSGLGQKQLRGERKRAKEALAESELRYRTLADSGHVLTWTCGPDRRWDYFNEPWLVFTGRTMEQELGQGWIEGLHPDDLDRCLQTYATACDRRESFRIEHRLRHASGDYRWIQNDATPRYDAKGTFLGYIGHCLDITERKQADAKLADQLDELRRWQDVMLDREDRVQELKGEVNELCRRLGEPVRYPSQLAAGGTTGEGR
jgi:PAS domain S-box-containing protein